MKLKTVEELSDKLDFELSWRRIELTNLKFNVEKVEGNILNTNLRSSLVLLYAHWEGFIKKSLTYYLEHVSKQKIKNNLLKSNFYALELHNKIRLMEETNNSVRYTEIINEILENVDNESNIPYKRQIDTKSNLKSELFKELMFTVGLDSTPYENYFTLIDERLLKTRNEIAHGEPMNQLELTKEGYLELHEKISTIMVVLKEQIISAAIKKLYRIDSIDLSENNESTTDMAETLADEEQELDNNSLSEAGEEQEEAGEEPELEKDLVPV